MKRESIKKIKIEVKAVKYEKMYMLIFTLPKPNFSISIGATNIYVYEDIKEMTSRIQTIFKNMTSKYVYVLEEDLQKEFDKIFYKEI